MSWQSLILHACNAAHGLLMETRTSCMSHLKPQADPLRVACIYDLSDHCGLYQAVGEFSAAPIGDWAKAAGGAWLWGLSIRSPGAKSQMLLFRQATVNWPFL